VTGATTLRSMRLNAVIVAALLVAGATGRTAEASDLHGSRDSMEKQHSVAVELDYSFALTASQVEEVVASGVLEPVTPNADFEMSGVSFPYAQHEVRQFIERLAAEYHAASGDLLVVTSLTRPVSQQPSNASPLSVHPAGMAVDLRIPSNRAARSWLSQRLLELEEELVLDVTLERKPAHLHVAVYPAAFANYAARQDSLVAQRVARRTVRIVAVEARPQTQHASRASSEWLFAALAGGMLLSFATAAFHRRSALQPFLLRIKRR
jgi:hypothetical protein